MSENLFQHRKFLELAIEEAELGDSLGQIPIGCIIIDRDQKILAKRHNEINLLKDLTAHAEALAIRDAIKNYGNESSKYWTLYSSLEPCLMCLGTIIMAQIGTVVWAAPDNHISTHLLLDTLPYFRSKNLIVFKAPFSDLEENYSKMYNKYWIEIGKPEKIQPVENYL